MLRTRQRELIQKILNSNEEFSLTDHRVSLGWKVLIYDDHGLYILTTLMKVARLLEVGVCYFAHIKAKREPIPDISAIYFVEPTEENLDLISEDCETPKYSKIDVNFISPISSDSLELFASKVSKKSNGDCINSIFDQFIDFSSTDPNMFTLFEKDNSMLDIFGYRTTDERAQSSLKQISNGLVSVFLTFGEIPRVLYPKENEISRIVADTFCVQIEPLAKNFELWGSRRSKTTNVKPPLLIILDRSLDYAGPLLHPSTYQALIHDNFGITKNEVNIDGKMYDLDCDLDKFWNENRMEVFGTVAERIGQEVKGFINRYGAIEDDLSGAISNLPELSHQQLSLKSHTKIGDSLLNKIKARKADTLFKIEEDMISNAGVTLDKLIETLQSIPEKSDRLRCASIAFLCDVIPHNELQRVEEIVGESLEFLNNYFERSKIIQHQNKGYVGRLLNKVGEFGSQFDSSAVAEKLPIVEKVRKIIEESIEGYILRNPLTGKTEPSPIGSVFVFVIGPGSYVEYNGLQNLGKRNNLEITYGCTSLVRPDDFMEMMKKLGN